MERKLVKETLFEFERGQDPKSSLGIGRVKRLKDELKAYHPYIYEKREVMDKELLDFCINRHKWDDLDFVLALPGKQWKALINGALSTLIPSIDNNEDEDFYIEKIDYLIKHGAKPGFRRWAPFKDAIWKGLPKIVSKFIELGADVHIDNDIPMRKAAEQLEFNSRSREKMWQVIRILADKSTIGR
jgi:hypothetical protein